MPTITVSQQHLELLQRLQKDMRTQDNRSTSYPIFLAVEARKRDKFITACFTQKGCEDFIAADGHNHDDPSVYVASGYRNEEWIQLRDFFLHVGLQENKGPDGGAPHESVKDLNTREALQVIAEEIDERLPSGWGFILMTFPFKGSDGRCNYVSSAKRESAIPFLEEFIKKSNEETFGKHV